MRATEPNLLLSHACCWAMRDIGPFVMLGHVCCWAMLAAGPCALLGLPVLPYDPGEQGDPMHSEAPAEMAPAAGKKKVQA